MKAGAFCRIVEAVFGLLKGVYRLSKGIYWFLEGVYRFLEGRVSEGVVYRGLGM
ncbi:hypothetical protein [Bartonella machadoae]|uniref:hypothetical protein n=1 Tax=Bartonella machadoae TaxID=2893471 RepID=UPI001F4D1AA1|nr:hypothetical protein [Bartonella machadoae]UNE53928.1 hypothetical protein LNM86_10140 [Bartonella machadoae]